MARRMSASETDVIDQTAAGTNFLLTLDTDDIG
jgi:hypothetical protein